MINPTQKIPHPPLAPIVKNLNAIQPSTPVQSMVKIAEDLGPIFQLFLPGRNMIWVSGLDEVNEVSDTERFDKILSRPLIEVRDFVGDGLFSAWTFEPNWQKAHNILIPGFGARAMKDYFPMMLDIATHLIAKWHNLTEEDEINVAEDMTRLTFDTIGLCGFDYRFHSFARKTPHPFVEAMVAALEDTMKRSLMFPLQTKLRPIKNHKYRKAVHFMNQTVDMIIEERRRNPELYKGKTDFLSLMLNGIDNKTGEGLSDTNIRYQTITFLIAGHETTSGLLSFALYFLLTNPQYLEKAYKEVDTVLGTNIWKQPTYQETTKLEFISQVLNESLRLWPTAPAYGVYPFENTTLGNRYSVSKGQTIMVLLPALHRNRAIWGEDALEFKPERFSPDNKSKIPTNAFKPFGNGQRACIGRQFATVEATLVLAMILQRFKFSLPDDFQLKIKETLTLKPENLIVRIRPRRESEKFKADTSEPTPILVEENKFTPKEIPDHATPMTILYGSNMGSSKDLAERIASDGKLLGFQVRVSSLDESIDNFPNSGFLSVITSTYNGFPPDNALQFAGWLKQQTPSSINWSNLQFTVFGCGNTDWKTYQKFPRFVSDQLKEFGAKAFHSRGEGNAAKVLEDDFENWYSEFWKVPLESAGVSQSQLGQKQEKLGLEWLDTTPSEKYIPTISPEQKEFVVRKIQELQNRQGPDSRSTKYLEFDLPPGDTYLPGDHLILFPKLDESFVQRICTYFSLDPARNLLIREAPALGKNLPLNKALNLRDLVKNHLDLQEKINTRQLRSLEGYLKCPPDQKKFQEYLNAWKSDDSILSGKSYLDILEDLPSCEIPFSEFLLNCSPMKGRYYSISSSQRAQPDSLAITVSVLKSPHWSGQGEYTGIASNYLSTVSVGDRVLGMVGRNKTNFRLPEDSDTPIILVGPGTGIAPFIGFLQEREILKQLGKPLGECWLYFGCRRESEDFLYREKLQDWQSQEILNVRVGFSRDNVHPKRYVQDLLWEDRTKIWDLLARHNANVYVCGDASGMAVGVRDTLEKMFTELGSMEYTDAQRAVDQLIDSGRYLMDIWS